MNGLDVALLVAGVALFVLSFVIPEKKEENSEDTKALIKDAVKEQIDKEFDDMKKHVELVVDEAVEYAQEKTERSLERISNEKIMAVNEYSDTVLGEINKNHQEVIFLYDMLEDKQQNLKESIADANQSQNKLETATGNMEALIAQSRELMASLEASIANISWSEVSGDVHSQSASVNGLAKHEVNEKNTDSGASSVTEGMQNQNLVTEEQSQKATGITGAFDVSMANLSRTTNASEPVKTKKIRTLNWAQEAQKAAGGDGPSSEFVNGFDKEIASLCVENVQNAHDASVNQQILSMYREGMDSVSIARRMNMGVGEVELITQLYSH